MTDKQMGGLFAALARAQSKLTAPGKNREVSVKMQNGGTYKFKYATLDHLIEHIRGPLTENGIWFVQMTEPGVMVTRIVHESGEFVDSAVPMPNLPNKPQEAGSVLSYFRRYSLAVALGLASDEDDDANIAEGNGYEDRKPQKRVQGQTGGGSVEGGAERISKAQWSKIVALLESTNTNAAPILTHFKVDDLKKLTAAQAIKAINQLEDKLSAMAKAESNKTLADELGDDIPY